MLTSILVPIAFMVLMGFVIYRLMDYLKLKATVSSEGSPRAAALEERLDTIERRLTDVQDVMIALSEKFDRWERDRHTISNP